MTIYIAWFFYNFSPDLLFDFYLDLTGMKELILHHGGNP